MRSLRPGGSFLTLGSGLLLLAACSAGTTSTLPSGSQPTAALQQPRLGTLSHMAAAAASNPDRGRGWLSEAAKAPGPKVYVADNAAGRIMIYAPTGGAPIGEITSGIDGPLGIWVTSSGALYVTNQNNNTVTVYPRGKTQPSATLAGVLPVSVAVSKTGDVYVSSFGSAVYYYRSGATKPTKTVALVHAQGIGIDAQQNPYVSYDDENFNGHVEKYGPGLIGGTDLGISLPTVRDARIAATGDLLLSSQTDQVIDTYKPGSTSPVSSISVPGAPYNFALNSTQTKLYVVNASTGTVKVYSYPAGVPQPTTFDGLTSAFGIALSPPGPY